MYKVLLYVILLSLVSNVASLPSTCICMAAEADKSDLTIAAEELMSTLDPFYKKHIVVDGLLIVGSENVSDYTLREVGHLAKMMLARRPEVMIDLIKKRRMYVTVMAYTEMQRDLPECKGLSPWWDYRARGLGCRPVSCGEENVLNLKGDPWAGESIFVHEFGHMLQGHMGVAVENFNERLHAIYGKAKQSGRFCGYAIEGGIGEFWAEGVQAYYNCNGTIRPKSGGGQSSFEVLDRQGKHLCHLQTRGQLKAHVPEYAALLDEAFNQNPWVYEPAANRLDQPHLKGFDPSRAPTFRWPPKVVEAFYRIEAEKKKSK